MTNVSFCTKCGTQLRDKSIFCSKCGVKKIKSIESPKETKYQIGAYKFQIILGSFLLVIGVVFLNFYTIFFGISIFAVGFVLLNTKSKTIKQLMGYISAILFAIAMVNLASQFI